MMMTGNMSIFEMGLLQLANRCCSVDVYFENPQEAKRFDKDLLQKLANPDHVEQGHGPALCDAINQADPVNILCSDGQ